MEKSQDYFRAVRKEIAPLLPEFSKSVLDVGCGAGVTSEWLRANKKIERAVGIERDPRALAEAKSKLDNAHSVDLESGDLHSVLADEKFNLILCLDILEHLTDPWLVLKNLGKHLSSDGYLIASIPNVRNYRVVLPLLLAGSWRYQETGILDSTHLRFFTKSSVIQLFQDSGYEIDLVRNTGRMNFSKSWWLNIFTLGIFREFLDFQYLIRAKRKS